jgi:CheY-like chemotaxis protein
MTDVSDTTVLIVDDEPFVAMLITDVLEELGCATIDASHGAMALDVLRSNRPVDMMITDIGLPGGISGRQLATEARSLRPGLKILFVTGYAHAGGVDDDPLAEGMQVITKPFAIEALEKRVRDMLAQ